MIKKLFILLNLIFIVSTVWADGIGHDSSKECAVCHFEWMPEFIHDLKGTDIVDFQSQKVVATEKMCFSCHNGTVADSRIRIWSGDAHVLKDKIPGNMQVPENLPLDHGAMNCRTCHTAHATKDAKAEGVDKGVFLRMENADSQLCQTCHAEISKGAHPSHPKTKPEKNFSAIENKLSTLGAKLGSHGNVVCESCHTPHSPKEKNLLIYPVSDSKLCSICHLDKVNPDNALYVKGMLNHPIDIRHENPDQVALVKKAGGIYAKSDEVICLTCHSPHHGKTDALLIKSNAENELCTTCHDNKIAVFNSKHDMHNVKGFRTKNGKTAHEKGTCQSCHSPHGWSLELPANSTSMLSAGCLSCHQEGKFAPNKVFYADRFSHPVDKKVKDGMQTGDLPLFPDQSENVSGIAGMRQSGNTVTCATCHDVHSSRKNSLRIEAEDGRLCLTCHTEKKMVKNSVHGQKKLSKSCLSCHTVHNCDNKRLLKRKENDGCLECHRKGGNAEKLLVDLNRSHPVNVVVNGQLSKTFKLSPEGRLTCVTCHDPHSPGSRNTMKKEFLRGDYTDTDAFCAACHETQKEVIGSDHDNRENVTDSVCGQCHRVHNAKTAVNIMAVDYAFKDKDDSCIACHNKNGTARQKTISGGHKLGKVDQADKYRRHLATKDGDVVIYCSTCHTVHNNGPRKGAEGTGKDSFLDRKLLKNGNLCLGCHDDKASFATSQHNVNLFSTHTEKSKTLKAEGNPCGICHAVHNSGYYLFEKSLGTDYDKICTSCHTRNGLASRTRITTSHPTNIKLQKNKKLTFLQEGKMVCVSCHEPHAQNKGMLRDLGKPNLCVACHEDQKAVESCSHNLANVAYLADDIEKDIQNNACAACHRPHNFHKDNQLMWAFDPGSSGWFGTKNSFGVAMCTDCHSKEGLGRKKVPEVLTHDNLFKILPIKLKTRLAQYLYDERGNSSPDGSITCQSCHDPHACGKDTAALDAGAQMDTASGFLKPGTVKDFCAKCHGTTAKELFNKFHDKKFRESRNKKQQKIEVLRNLMIIQMNLDKSQKD